MTSVHVVSKQLRRLRFREDLRDRRINEGTRDQTVVNGGQIRGRDKRPSAGRPAHPPAGLARREDLHSAANDGAVPEDVSAYSLQPDTIDAVILRGAGWPRPVRKIERSGLERTPRYLKQASRRSLSFDGTRRNGKGQPGGSRRKMAVHEHHHARNHFAALDEHFVIVIRVREDQELLWPPCRTEKRPRLGRGDDAVSLARDEERRARNATDPVNRREAVLRINPTGSHG